MAVAQCLLRFQSEWAQLLRRPRPTSRKGWVVRVLLSAAPVTDLAEAAPRLAARQGGRSCYDGRACGRGSTNRRL
jgi:hypothetical protein